MGKSSNRSLQKKDSTMDQGDKPDDKTAHIIKKIYKQKRKKKVSKTSRLRII